MKEPFVFLCPEVTRDDAELLSLWLSDAEVGKFLSDDHAAFDIEEALSRSGLPVVTHLFNRGGRFFLVCNKQHRPVGFVRLATRKGEAEIVIAIGARNNWGRRLGRAAIREALKTAFFEMRYPRIVAKIHKENTRSLRAFRAVGFRVEFETENYKSFALTMSEYLKHMMDNPVRVEIIQVTKTDYTRLRDSVLSAMKNDPAAAALERELGRAIVTEPKELPQDVVSMNSQVVIEVDGREEEVRLAYPQEAGEEGRLSVLSHVGTAILGYGEGDVIDWEVGSSVCLIRIEKILYQPEAAGDFHL